MMHKNYNSCLHILDMHLERGETSVFTKKTNSSFSVAFVTNMVLYILYHSTHGQSWLLAQSDRNYDVHAFTYMYYLSDDIHFCTCLKL